MTAPVPNPKLATPKQISEANAVVIEQLRSHYLPSQIMLWMASPNEQLDGRTPIGLVAEGRVDEVLAVIDRMDAGAYL